MFELRAVSFGLGLRNIGEALNMVKAACKIMIHKV